VLRKPAYFCLPNVSGHFMDRLLKIKELIMKEGIISFSNHYEDNFLEISYSLDYNSYQLIFHDNDFVSRISIHYKEVNNDIVSHNIVLEKNTNKVDLINYTFDFRGDPTEVKLPLQQLDEFIYLFETKCHEIENVNHLRTKLIHNFKSSALKILNTEMVYKENVANFSIYNNGGAYLGIASKMNKQILTRLYEYPKTISWLDLSRIQNYGFNNSTELIEFIAKSKEFIDLNSLIKATYPEYELQIFRKLNNIVLSVST
jgi:hypothetical protein